MVRIQVCGLVVRFLCRVRILGLLGLLGRFDPDFGLRTHDVMSEFAALGYLIIISVLPYFRFLAWLFGRERAQCIFWSNKLRKNTIVQRCTIISPSSPLVPYTVVFPLFSFFLLDLTQQNCRPRTEKDSSTPNRPLNPALALFDTPRGGSSFFR